VSQTGKENLKISTGPRERTAHTTRFRQVLDISNSQLHIECKRTGLCTNELITWKQRIKYADNLCSKEKYNFLQELSDSLTTCKQ
jgi:hypothetical protein